MLNATEEKSKKELDKFIKHASPDVKDAFAELGKTFALILLLFIFDGWCRRQRITLKVIKRKVTRWRFRL